MVPKDPRSAAMRLGDLHRPHRRREVTPRGQPAPELVPLVLPIRLDLLKRAPIHPGAPRFAFPVSQASCTSHFEIANDLPDDISVSTQLLPDHRPVDRPATATDDPAPSLHPRSRGFRATTGRSASAPRAGTQSLTVSAAWDAPSRPRPAGGWPCRGTPSHLPRRSRRPGSRRLHAGHPLPNQRAPARLLPEL